MDMSNITWDWPIFDVLNFEGPEWLDCFMVAVSGVMMWIPLYILIIYMVWRSYRWRGVVALLVAVALAMGMADIIAGIFKHSGPLKGLWPDFPVRPRPMFTDTLGDVHVVSTNHGTYGTVSAHAATPLVYDTYSALCAAYMLFAYISCLPLSAGYTYRRAARYCVGICGPLAISVRRATAWQERKIVKRRCR